MSLRISIIVVTVTVLVVLAFVIKRFFSPRGTYCDKKFVIKEIKASNVSLDPCKIEVEDNQVIYDGIPTCVAWQPGSKDPALVNARYWKFGVFTKIQQAVDNGGVHPDCPQS